VELHPADMCFQGNFSLRSLAAMKPLMIHGVQDSSLHKYADTGNFNTSLETLIASIACWLQLQW
jgi:hypothetical protein